MRATVWTAPTVTHVPKIFLAGCGRSTALLLLTTELHGRVTVTVTHCSMFTVTIRQPCCCKKNHSLLRLRAADKEVIKLNKCYRKIKSRAFFIPKLLRSFTFLFAFYLRGSRPFSFSVFISSNHQLILRKASFFHCFLTE